MQGQPRPGAPGAEADALVAQILEADARLDALLGGQADSVTDTLGRTVLLRRAQGHLRGNEQARQLGILNVLPAQVALLDARGTILVVNEAWRQFGDANGLRAAQHAVGMNYLAVCAASTTAEGIEAGEGIARVLDGAAATFTMEYPCHAPGEERWFMLRVMPLASHVGSGVVVMHVDVSERRRIANELSRLSQETERRERMLATMLSSSADLTYAIDRQRRVIYANQATLSLWGLRLEDAVGRTTRDLRYPEELSARLDRQIDDVFRTSASVTDETTFVDAAGQPGYFEYILSPAFDADGRVDFVVGCSRDITTRKRAGEALQESISEFRTLASAMPQIVWASAGGEFIYLNTQWMDYTGRALAESLGGGWTESLHPADRDAAQQAHHAAWMQGVDCSLELRLARADGAWRWWLLRGVPVRDEAGNVVKCIGTFTDIDELKQAEAEISRANRELQHQRSELRTLFDLVPAMVWFKDTEGRVLQVNKRAAAAMGLSVDEALGLQISDFYPESASRYEEEDREVIRTGQPLQGKLEAVQDADGRTAWFQSDKVPCRDDAGQVIGIIVMKHDMTERKAVEDALNQLNATLEARVQDRTAELERAHAEAQRANRAKSTFLATMSHEIRTPMSGLLGLLELLDLSALDAEQHSTLSVARESGHALKRIIDGILDFSKVEADSLELDVAPSSIRAVVDGVCRLHDPLASGKNLLLRAQVSPAVSHYLKFDAVRLGQILHNFVGNAIKFTDRGGIDVQVEHEWRDATHERLRITVRDTGIGIAPEKIGRLFQPFVQADAQTATEFGGTGLGLFIARRLAERMGGDVAIASEPGRGTALTLRVAFELCTEEFNPHQVNEASRRRLNALVAARPAPPTVEQAARLRRLLLVVDDHPINRMVLLRQASTLGYAAEAAADGVEALDRWESGRFGAVLTDCNMPRMNGFELASAIRRREAGTGVRTAVIGCTANAMADAAAACLASGMDDSLTKPIALQELYDKLERWLPGAEAVAAACIADPATHDVQTGANRLDMDLVAAIASDGATPIRDVLEDFRSCNAADAARLRQAGLDGDLDSVVDAAHRLAGACSMLGAQALADASAAVHAAARQADLARVAQALVAFEHAFEELDRFLRARLSAVPSLPH